MPNTKVKMPALPPQTGMADSRMSGYGRACAEAMREAGKVKMPKYSWSPPKLFVGQGGEFIDHRGIARVGSCDFVETKYRQDGSHFHIYAMRQPGHKRAQWVGDKSIIRALEVEQP